MKRNLYGMALFFLSTLTVSCGYSTKSALPAHFRTIYIENFKNNVTYTTETQRELYLPLLEVKVRNAVINRFLFDGVLKVVKSENADLILKGELKKYERTGLRFTDNNDVQEYRVSVVVSLELRDPSKLEPLWTESNFAGEASFFLSGPSAKSEDAAVQEAIDDLARRVVERTLEDW